MGKPKINERGKKNEHFTQAVKQLAEREGWGGKQLAEKLGVSVQTGYNCLNGRVPEWWVLVRLAELLSTSVDWLLTGREAEYKEAPGHFLLKLPRGDPNPVDDTERADLEAALEVMRAKELAGGYAQALVGNIRAHHAAVKAARATGGPSGKKAAGENQRN